MIWLNNQCQLLTIRQKLSDNLNIYEDIIEICTSVGMNIIVAVGFWFNWKDESKNYDKRD